MQIYYNVTGEKRKSLVGAISLELNAPITYLGVPTFAYAVGDYRIDKSGILSGEDNPELVADLQGLHSFIAVSEEYDSPLPTAETIPDDFQITYGEPEPDKEISNLSIEIPLTNFTVAAFENLKRLVDSKTSIIKKALGVNELPLEVSEEAIRFPWFEGKIDDEAVRAYTQFVTALCEMAKTQQRITSVDKPVENEKYAFRCFLLRLGFIGSEYKTTRKILLSKLSGNSAFRNAPASDEE